MIPKEVLRKIRKIQITTSRMVTDVFAGKYQSVFKGKGMEFYEVREYLPGDEIRSIDWNVTARMGHPYIKKFIEERELTVMFLLDGSMSCHFGSSGKLKNQIAAELCSVLAFSAIQNNDKVGLIIFTDRIEKFIPPKKGLRHVLRVIREALYYKPKGKGTDIPLALECMNRVMKRKTITFIISDFIAENFQKTISVSNRRHDIIAVTVTDPRELSMPDIGIVQFSDAEKGTTVFIDTANRDFRKFYAENAQKRIRSRNDIFHSANVDNIDIRTNQPYIKALIKFFWHREKKLRY